jgi:hypothetical protein
MGIVIGALCLAIAAGGLARVGFPALDRLFALAAPLIGATTFAAVLAAYLKAAPR